MNPKTKDVVRTEILKLLAIGILYPIADSKWASLVHCVPKKGDTTIVLNDKNELIPQRIIIGYRMCIDYMKLNKATRKDHYLLSFIDQMLESLSKNVAPRLRGPERPVLQPRDKVFLNTELLI